MIDSARESLVEPEGHHHEPLPDWLKWLLGLVAAATVAYFTAQTEVRTAQTRIEERENNHYQELKASIDLLRQDVRDLRGSR